MQKLLSLILIGFFLIASQTIFAQESRIARILNKEIEKEIKGQLSHAGFNGDTLKVIQPFSISDDKRLSFVIRKALPTGEEGYVIEKLSVELKDIEKLNKDINILFEAKFNAVKIYSSLYFEDGHMETTSVQASSFYTYLYLGKDNKKLRDELLDAFKKAGYNIKSDFWAD